MKKIGFIVVFSLVIFCLRAGVHCPDNVIIDCNHDYYNLDFVGEATTYGNHINVPARYTDVESLTACNVGTVQRIWYADVNNNGSFESTEPNCTQLITINYIDHPFSVNFPQDVYINCEEDIPDAAPSWVSGPCDQVAYSVKEENFVGFSNACRVIQRRYTVINWCEYQPNNPNWNGDGIYEAIQLIHLDDNTAPEITSCEIVRIPLEEDCMASISLTNSASDLNFCGAGLLGWYVSVDLWGDGSVEYQYSPEETGDFFLDYAAPGDQVQIDLPERLTQGRHKVTWKVIDFCGNVANCNQELITEDQKPPTPYCRFSTQAVVTGGVKPVTLRASSFDLGGFDNCSPSMHISFGPSPSDSVRLLDCDDLGFQFAQLYYTDQSGNADFCSVGYFVMDNGKCASNLNLVGRITDLNGNPVDGNIEARLQDDLYSSLSLTQGGEFDFDDLVAHEELYFKYYDNSKATPLSIEDLVLLRDHILGRLTIPLSESLKWIADINLDGRVNPQDMIEAKKMILSPNSFVGLTHKIIKRDKIIDDAFSHESYSAPNLLDFDGSLDLIAVDNGYISSLYADFGSEDEQVKSFVSEDNNELIRTYQLSHDQLVDGLYVEFEVDTRNTAVEDMISSELLDVEADITSRLTDRGTLITMAKAFGSSTQLLNEQVIFSINENYNIIDWNEESRLISKKETMITKSFLNFEVDNLNRNHTEIVVYPNPSLTNHVKVDIYDHFDSAVILDSDGKLVKNILEAEPNKTTFELSLDPGVYFLQVIKAKKSTVKKMIILD